MMVVRCLRFLSCCCGQSSSSPREKFGWALKQQKRWSGGGGGGYWPLSLPKPKSATEPQTPADIKLAAGW